MAKKLNQQDLLKLSSINTPPTDSVAFAAKSDGLYQKVGTTESKLSTTAELLDRVKTPVPREAKFTDTVVDISGKVDKITGKGLSTNDYTSAEKTKLAGIATGANKYSLPTASSSVLGGIKVGSRLSISNGVLSATQQTANNFTNTLKNKLDGIAAGATNLKLGTSSSTAYRGDRGNAAYTHISDAVKHITAAERTSWNDKYTKTEVDNKLDILPAKEAYLQWGGRNLSGRYSPIDAAMVPTLGANRAAFIKPEGVTIEYTRDGGTTWIDYGSSDASKIGFLQLAAHTIGKSTTSNPSNGSCQLRVTINTGLARIYTALNKFVMYVSTSGSQGSTVTIEKALESTPTNFINTNAVNIPISGYSGYNVINTENITTYGNRPASQYGRLRFTFKNTSVTTGRAGLIVYSIFAYGGVGWTTPSTLARSGLIYSFDTSQNVTFPSNVKATSFTGNASSATNCSRSVVAGNGLTGGGALTANRTLTLGTPSAITLSSTNSVAATSHTHAFTPGGSTSQYIRGDGSLATYKDTTYIVATTSADGLMSSGDKSKLNNIASNANNYSLPTASGSTLGGIKIGSRLTITSGVLSANVQSDNNFTTTLKNKLDGIATGATNLSLGTSSSTAYRGDRGNAAYTHISDAVKHITADERTAWNNKWDYNATTIAGVKVTNATNADKATTLTTARTIGITGGVTGTATSFNGSKNISIPITAMDASKLSTGTLPDARLSGTYTGFSHKINGTNTIFTSPSSGSDARGRTVFGLAEYRAHSSAATGAIVFIAPFTKASTIMKSIEIDGMIYSPSNAVRVIINNYTSGLTKKMSYGTVDIQVRVGETADGKFCVILGDVATKWYYPHFTLSKAMFSHSSVADTSCYGWTTALVTSLTGYVNISAEISNSALATNITGSATKLTTARTIGGVSFNGTANINLPGVNTAGNQNTSGTAAKATILANTRAINGTNFDGSAAITTARWGTARTLSFTGDVTGSSSVNGSENVATAMTLANVATAGTYKSVTINAKGLVTAGTNPTTLSGYGITDGVTSNATQTITGGKTFSKLITASAGISTTTITASGIITATGGNSTNWNKAYADSHTHTNKAQLDVIDQNLSMDSSVGFNSAIIENTIEVGELINNGKSFMYDDLEMVEGDITTPVINIGAKWSIELSGTELVFKHKGVTKQRLLSDGSIVAVGEVTAITE